MTLCRFIVQDKVYADERMSPAKQRRQADPSRYACRPFTTELPWSVTTMVSLGLLFSAER